MLFTIFQVYVFLTGITYACLNRFILSWSSFVKDPPFVMLKKNSGDFRGNDRYEGYLVDLLHVVAERLNFRYEIYECPDGNYGSYDKEKDEWNGMVKELIDGVSRDVHVKYALTLVAKMISHSFFYDIPWR